MDTTSNPNAETREAATAPATVPAMGGASTQETTEPTKDPVQSLADELQQTKVKIDSANSTLATTQADLKDLNAKRSSLQRIVDDLSANQAALKKQRESGADAQLVGQRAHDDVLAQIPENRRKAVEDAIKSVDDDISTADQARSTAQQDVDDATKAANDAKAAAAAHGAALRDAQTELRGLSSQGQQAQAQVTRLAQGARGAADAGHPAEAYYQAVQLESALTGLAEVMDPEHESDLQGNISTEWSALNDAKQKAEQSAKTLSDKQKALADAVKTLQSKRQGREATIKSKLADLEKQWSSQPAAAAASTSDSSPAATGTLTRTEQAGTKGKS